MKCPHRNVRTSLQLKAKLATAQKTTLTQQDNLAEAISKYVGALYDGYTCVLLIKDNEEKARRREIMKVSTNSIKQQERALQEQRRSLRLGTFSSPPYICFHFPLAHAILNTGFQQQQMLTAPNANPHLG